MNLKSERTIGAIIIALAPSWLLAQEIPSSKELLSYVSIPSYWEIQDFRVIASQLTGDPISPRAQVRFEADVSPTKDLFVKASPDGLGPFTTLIRSSADADFRTLYGTMDLGYQAGAWSGSVNIENPLAGLGEPQDMFATPTLVLGSDQQKQIADLLTSAAASELNASVAATRQSLEQQAQQKLQQLIQDQQQELSDLKSSHAREVADWQSKQSGLDTERETKLAEVAADLQSEAKALTEAHDEEVAKLTSRHADRLRELLTRQEAEITEKAISHAQALGEMATRHEQEISTARAGYDALLDSLNARIASSDEILKKQQALIEQSSQIVENETDLAALIAEKTAKDKAALSDLLGTWRGTVNCYDQGRYNLWPVNFKATQVSGKNISGDFENEAYGDSYIGMATLSVNSKNLVPPISMTLRLTKNAIVAMELKLEMTLEGLIIGESSDQVRSGQGSVCLDIQLSKSE